MSVKARCQRPGASWWASVPGDGGRQRVVRPVQHRDPLGPRVAPVAERLGVSGPGPQEIPPDMSKAPQRVHAVDAGQRLVGLVEVRGDDQAAAGLQL